MYIVHPPIAMRNMVNTRRMEATRLLGTKKEGRQRVTTVVYPRTPYGTALIREQPALKRWLSQKPKSSTNCGSRRHTEWPTWVSPPRFTRCIVRNQSWTCAMITVSPVAKPFLND